MKIHNVEQQTSQWEKLKLGRIGSSSFSNLMGKDTGKLSKLADKLKDQLSPDYIPPYNIKTYHTERGNKLEPIAREVYEYRYKINIVQLGYIESNYKTFGMSPDGVIYSGSNIVGAIEIKCRNLELFEKFKSTFKIPSTAINQIVAYFVAIPTLEYVDYVEFSDEVPYKNCLQVKRVNRNDLDDKIKIANERLMILDRLVYENN